jgi:uncharacterized membrane protein YbhN (UPF0104 family)
VLAGGGQVRAQAVAAALLFRLLTYGLQIPLGGFTYLIWQRNKRWRMSRVKNLRQFRTVEGWRLAG